MDSASDLLTLPNELLKQISFYLCDDPTYNARRPQQQLLNFSMCNRQLRAACSPAIWHQFIMRRRTSSDSQDYTIDDDRAGAKSWLVNNDRSTGEVTVPEALIKYGCFVRSFRVTFSLDEPSFDADWAMFCELQKHCPGITALSAVVHVLDDASTDYFARFFGAVEQKLPNLFRRLNSAMVIRNAFDMDHTPHTELAEVLARLPLLKHFSSLGVAISQKLLCRIFAGKSIETAMFSESECDGDDPDAILSVVKDPLLLRDIAVGNNEFITSSLLQPLTQALAELSDTDKDRFPYLRLLDMSGCESIDCEKLLYYSRTHQWPNLYSLDLSRSVISMKMLPAIGDMCPNLRTLGIAAEFGELENDGNSLFEHRIGRYFVKMLEKLSRLQLLELAFTSQRMLDQLFGPNMPGVLKESLVSLRLSEEVARYGGKSNLQAIATGLAKMKALRSVVIEIENPKHKSKWEQALSGPEFSRAAVLILC
ncbi:hypothetical protein DL89DRAFT_264370 [Linderina pennispora]|uniref:F-box domain-containing protein n=1 Tax=Linderina pennispora TaxID=61395 RepID=A0A1Y1WMA8_9FUNG|nr:uncharacterized protein DL89DRAFT_264370 [Linderina pennispora]ORX74515.1 hypothetical protein DL89DRAFT_264370 [Linderina pennispora]